jgi:phenylacetate-CoA ligase
VSKDSLERAGFLTRARNSAVVAGLAFRERNLPRRPLEYIERVQRRNVKAMVRHAYDSVPFYRRAMDAEGSRPEDMRSAADLARLPVIDGATVRHAVEDFTSSRYGPGARETFMTSGSETGVRREIHWDARYLVRGMAWAERDRLIMTRLAGEPPLQTRLRELAESARLHRVLGRLVGDSADHQRMSIFPGNGNSRIMRLLWADQTLIPPRPAHHHFVPAQLPFDEVLELMNEIRPRIVFSFGSYADQFFRRIEEGELHVELPRVWMYNSDHMSAGAREFAERRGCLIYSLYSAMEAHRMGIQCERRDGYHLNIDLHAFRVIDEDGRDVEPGTPGDLVVSNLHNRAMVLLNYRIGDRAVLDPEPCRCGRTLPLLARLEGRRSEQLHLADGRQLSSLAIEGLFRRQLTPTLKVQIEQSAPGALLWRIVPFERIDRPQLAGAVVAQARAVLGEDTEVAVEFVEDIPVTPQGKYLRAVHPTPGGGA